MRVAWLDRQVVAGDEVFPISAMRLPLDHLFTTFRQPDPCIPITAWCRLLLQTVGLEEWGFRLVAVVPGCLLPWVLVRASRRRLEPADRLLLLVLVAGSPLLVFWSRTARPYAAVALLGLLAVLGVDAYLRRPRRRTLFASAAAMLAMFWLSPTTLPWIGCLGAAAVAYRLRESPARDLPRALRAAAPAAVALLLIAASAAPAVPSLLELLTKEHTPGREFGWETPRESALLWFGFAAGRAPTGWLVVIPVALAIAGLVRLGRRHPATILPALLLLGVPPLLYATREFRGLGHASVFVRYQAANVPLVLALVVFGFAGLRDRLAGGVARRRTTLSVVGVALAAVHVASGPLRGSLPPDHPFGPLHSTLILRGELSTLVDAEEIPEYYRRSPAETLVEWVPDVTSEHLIAAYQRHHGRAVVRAVGARGYSKAMREGLRFETYLYHLNLLDADRLSGADVVIHRNPTLEELRSIHGTVPGDLIRQHAGDHAEMVAAAIARCRRKFGDPHYDDGWLAVFRVP